MGMPFSRGASPGISSATVMLVTVTAIVSTATIIIWGGCPATASVYTEDGKKLGKFVSLGALAVQSSISQLKL